MGAGKRLRTHARQPPALRQVLPCTQGPVSAQGTPGPRSSEWPCSPEPVARPSPHLRTARGAGGGVLAAGPESASRCSSRRRRPGPAPPPPSPRPVRRPCCCSRRAVGNGDAGTNSGPERGNGAETPPPGSCTAKLGSPPTRRRRALHREGGLHRAAVVASAPSPTRTATR